MEGVGSEAAASYHTPGTCNYGGASSLGEAVDHRLGQLCLFYDLFNVLQLLVIAAVLCVTREQGHKC